MHEGITADLPAYTTRIRVGVAPWEQLTLGLRSCGVVATHAWRCTPAKGSYTWTVTATDPGGGETIARLPAAQGTVPSAANQVATTMGGRA